VENVLAGVSVRNADVFVVVVPLAAVAVAVLHRDRPTWPR